MNIHRFLPLFLFAWLLAAPGGGELAAATLPFQFTLDENATTSAGVFKPDGTLVRTLWRKVDYPKGTHLQTWDGLSDELTAAPAGNYTLRVLSHHLDYIWQGSIGNTSTALTGPTVHRGFYPISDLAISGGDAFYITGYVEGDYDFRHFLTSDMQRLNDHWCWYLNRANNQLVSQTGNIFTPSWVATDTDGTWVYFASPDSTDPVTREQRVGPGFVVASSVATRQSVSFTNGAPIENGPAEFLPFANGIKVGKQKGVAGIAVQKNNGTLLAVSVKSEGKIYLFHKRTGAVLKTIALPAPGALSFAPNGDLWAISGTTVCKITSPETSAAINPLIPRLQQPLDVAVNAAGDLIAVVDAGASQQVKAYSPAGAPVWTLGQPGGHASNGPAVKQDKFLFLDRDGNPQGSLAFGPDGSLWLSDPGNRRLLHFTADRSYLDELMFQNVSYSSSVDANNPTRVFCDYLEFAIDYSKPLAQGWKLVANWGANLPKAYFDFACGVRQVATLANGRTYGAVTRAGAHGSELVELTAEGTRLTGIPLRQTDGNPGTFETLDGSGSVRRGEFFGNSEEVPANARATFAEKPLLGFDAANNPLWGEYTPLASAPAAGKNPVIRCCSLGNAYVPITSSDVVISFDPTKNNGWHLGGVRRGGSDWLWKASPSVASSVPLDGLGSFDIGDGVNYPGNSAFTSGRNVIFGYHGEFWANSQACQFMHFYDDGLFVGQFGESGLGHNSFEGPIAGVAGNSAFSCVTTVGGKVYLWANDESQHGPQRWLLEGTQTIRETEATGTLGQLTPLDLPAAPHAFPTGLAAQPGDGRVSLTWNPVPGAKSYQIKLATTRGGSRVLVAGGVTGPGKTITNFTNGQTGYFVVSAITEAGESIDSDPVAATPASLSNPVEIAGRYDQMGNEPSVLQVDPGQAALGKPSLQRLSPLLGDLTRRDIGSAGYQIFKWKPSVLTDLVNLPFGDRIEVKSGWKTDGFLSYQFQVGSEIGANSGLYVDPAGGNKGTLDITPRDPGVYYLTLVMPSRFRDGASYVVRLTPQGQSTPAASYALNEAAGFKHLYQFRFRGPVTLTVESLSGPAVIQAIFLDKANLIPQETSSFELWRQQNFSAADLANPSVTSPAADPDGDGQPNLLEYALGSAPGDGRSRPNWFSTLANWLGTPYLTLQFTRDRSVNDVTLRVAAGGDLTRSDGWVRIDPDNPAYQIGNWLDVPAKGLQTIIVRDVQPAGNGPRFMRLSVDR